MASKSVRLWDEHEILHSCNASVQRDIAVFKYMRHALNYRLYLLRIWQSYKNPLSRQDTISASMEESHDRSFL